MISDEHRCIFVHIPRSGGTSIESALWKPPRTEDQLWMGFVDKYHNKYQTGGLQHLHAGQIRTAVGDARFDSYFKFSFVRNPFSKVVSQYAYMQGRADLRRFLGMRKDTSFRRYLKLIQRRLHVQWEPQRNFVYEGDHLAVDFLGHYETIGVDMAKVFERVGVDARLPHLNRSERRDTREYYGPKERAVIESVYADDLETFGYSFADL
jgi:hypothetical protein